MTSVRSPVPSSHRQKTTTLAGDVPLGRLALGLVIVGLGVSVWLRLAPVFADFPFGDGGLFWVMGGELRENGFVPPDTTSYNRAGIPWIYPPLGLYALAAVGGGIEWLRIFPALFAIGTLPALWLLARALTNERAAIVAVLAYGLTLAAYHGLVAGGGITRAPGVLFAVLTMWAVVERRPGAAGVLGGLTILIHPIAAFYGALSCLVLWAARGADRRTLLALPIALLIGGAWFGPMIARHGFDALLGASGSRSFDLGENALVFLASVLNPPNLAFSIGAAGLVTAWLRRRWDLLAWVTVTFLGVAVLDRWLVIPFAILAGLAVDAALTAGWGRRTVGMMAVVAVVATTGVLLTDGHQGASPDERAVMEWARAETPSGSTFAVIGYNTDAAFVEWFPALSERRNLTTWQGTEWLPGDQTSPAVEAAACDAVACLPGADYFVLRPGCCRELEASLRRVGPQTFVRSDE
jgi:hypothetical protein